MRNRAGLVLAFTLLLVVGVRVRLRDMPLERDEGEYAYAGQLILQGVPPYQEAYNMKLPGTYVAYAVIMALFGQTPGGIHLGLALVNAATIILIFLLGRKLLDAVGGAVAALAYALMSLSPNVLGLAGHATHFVVLPAVGGILLLLRAVATRGTRVLMASGILFGLAFLMKQHGIFFGVFAGIFLWWSRFGPQFLAGNDRTPRRTAAGDGWELPPKFRWADVLRDLTRFGTGFVAPYLLLCLVLWAAGVFPQFWFWTVTYGSRYASAIPLVKAAEMTSATLRAMVGPNILFWLLPWVGAIMMWWDRRLDADRRFLLTALLVCSLASISVGFYFREHYFILLLPVLALLIAVAVSRSLRLLGRKPSLELFLALAVLVVSALALGAVLIGNGAMWFALSPKRAVEETYGSTVFGDAREAGEFIQRHAAPTARVAVIGSEPEIYFHAHRRAATGHIYVYALMERHPYAAKMQEEMIRQIETGRPDYVVYVQNNLSWLAQPESEKKLLDWWPAYWAANLELVRTINTRQGALEIDETKTATETQSGQARNYLLVFKRKGAP